jgi:hypothetical protein
MWKKLLPKQKGAPMDSFSQNTERLAEEHYRQVKKDFPKENLEKKAMAYDFTAGRNSAKAELDEALRILAGAVEFYNAAPCHPKLLKTAPRFREPAIEAKSKVTSLLGLWPSDNAKGD